MIKNLRELYVRDDEVLDDGASLVETILIIAIFAIAIIVVGGWLVTALMNTGADVAECIEGANTTDTKAAAANCKKNKHAKDNSFKKEDSYRDRYGNK